MASCFSLNAFESHSLADQSSSALMDRVDTKYLIDAAELNQCLAELTAEYTVLEMNGCRGMAYDTLYFDTPGRQLYLDHHNGKLNRVKVRTRHYRATGERFLEVKVKTNKLRTSKQRMVLTGRSQTHEFCVTSFKSNWACRRHGCCRLFLFITIASRCSAEPVTSGLPWIRISASSIAGNTSGSGCRALCWWRSNRCAISGVHPFWTS